ncbi:MAG: beta-ketoacyl-[acyl-carrier-protein] synthase family protein [Candidatus Omnitrophica bacterium]|nr:beta-ketoacyl-[acyl-carrier-protein] synthase family protein [Candidatus Omnitrophota bacterium]
MENRVVVSGLGIVSSLGSSIDEFWSNLTEGKSGISQVSSFDTSNLERHYAGEVKEFDPSKFYSFSDMALMPRTHQLAASATVLAAGDACLKDFKDVGLALGSLVGGLEYVEGLTKDISTYPVNSVSAHVCDVLGIESGVYTLSCACAAGNYAISLAYDMIKSGKEDIVLAGGADYFSMSIFLSFYRLFSLSAARCQPFDKNRRGLLPAEGAGMLVLESLSSAKRRGARIYAEVLGYGTSVDAYHAVIPSEEGVYSCMMNALDYSGVAASDIDYISAHGTGTVPNDYVECKAIKKLFGEKLLKNLPVSSIKSMLGHAMGAASSIEALSCCLAIDKAFIPPTINYETPDPDCDIDCVPNQARKKALDVVLNNSFGFGGMNCSVVFSRFS